MCCSQKDPAIWRQKLWLWLPTTLSLFYLWGLIVMEFDLISAIIGGAVTLVVSVLTLFGVQLSESRQLKRDSESIKETKNIAADTKLTVTGLNASVEAIKPSISQIDDRTKKIDSIATEIAIFRELRNGTSGGVRPEVMLASMSAVFEENAMLKNQVKEAQNRVLDLTEENQRLNAKVHQLEGKLRASRSHGRDEYEFEP